MDAAAGRGGLPLRASPADVLKAYAENKERIRRELEAEYASPPTFRQYLHEKFESSNHKRGIFGFTAAQRRALARAGKG